VKGKILVGSRGSALALAQASEVISALREITPGLTCEIVAIKTKGDKLHESGESASEGKSSFTKEIEDSLLKDEVQIAVHSMKDLPTDLPPGLTIAAVPRRADHRDALISRSKRKFDALPGRARIGTSSPRRRTQLLAARSDIDVEDVHGNVDTRLRKLDSGGYDAIVLAAVGLARLGFEKRITEYLSIKTMLPAIGQGALAIETREDDHEIIQLVSRLDDKSTRRAVEAERAFARRLGASCRTPIAAYARRHDGGLAIDGMVSSADGRMVLRGQHVSDGTDSENVGEELAESLLKKGAQLVLEAS
jgi:hydroxymethylbilane synthase